MSVTFCQICGYEPVAWDANSCPKCHTRHPISDGQYKEYNEQKAYDRYLLGGGAKTKEEYLRESKAKEIEKLIEKHKEEEEQKEKWHKEQAEQASRNKKDSEIILTLFVIILIIILVAIANFVLLLPSNTQSNQTSKASSNSKGR
jgi:hypothetical protein